MIESLYSFKYKSVINIAIILVYIVTDIQWVIKSIRHSLKFTSKTYEKNFFSKISIVRIYYVNHNDLGTVVKLIDCIFRKK